MDPSYVKNEVERIQWFHRIDLGNGLVTPGVSTPGYNVLPNDLSGMTVLDVGAADGAYSFEAERRGAKRVLAIDYYYWNRGWGSKAGFELARKVLESKVEDMDIDLFELTPEKVGSFDLVLLMGVLQMVRHPFLALERVFSVTGKQLILQAHLDMQYCRTPAMRFYPGRELENDPEGWWGPNQPALEAMLKAAGFRDVKRIWPQASRRYRLGKLRSAVALRKKKPFMDTLGQEWVIFHAWR